MKKLLFTLFAFAIIIACDKDNLDQDVMNINVLEQAEEINASVDIDFDAYKAQLESLMGVLPNDKGNSSSLTQRGGDNGSNWIELAAFNGTGADANAIFAHVVTDGHSIVCYDGFTLDGAAVVPATYSFDPTGSSTTVGILTIEVAGSATPYEIRGALRTTYIASFGNSFDSVFRVARTSNGGFSVSGGQPSRSDFTFPSCAPAAVDTDISTTATGITLTFDGVNVWTGTIAEGTVGSVVISGGYAAGTGYYDTLGAQISSTIDLATLPVGNNRFTFRSRVNGQGSSITGYVNITVTSSTPVAAAWTAGTGADSNLFTHADLGSYRVTAAPFPLTGFLATVVSDSTSPANTNNYAGTSEQAVRDAIEANFAE